jgi:glycerol-3-phosphate cytidylyltransferase-like family protein
MRLFSTTTVHFVRGTFDPLLAAHAQELVSAVKPDSKLVVIVDAGVDPILPVRARAELVAGVRAVDYVIPLEHGEDFETSSMIDLVATHNARLADLIEHVRRRAE